tara:strand:+ start:1010 stop:1492 length:483 start_codon:yes stop_codon:yes gene_type:complete
MHPYKDKACGGRAMAAKRYASGGGLYGDSDGPTGHPTGGADQYKPDMNMVNKGLSMIQKGGEAPSGGDQDFLKLKFMDLKPMGKAAGGRLDKTQRKADGGSADGPTEIPKMPKMPMKLKFLDLKPTSKARGGSAELPRLPKLPTTKLPMKLKFMKLKGMK